MCSHRIGAASTIRTAGARLIAAATLLGLSASGAAAHAARGTGLAPFAQTVVCDHEFSVAKARIPALRDRRPARLEESVRRAMTLFRFDRTRDALGKLDAALEILGGAEARDVSAERRREAATAINGLRSCMAATQPPKGATLTVRAFDLDPNAPGARGKPAGAGVYVQVEEIPVGTTGGDGTLVVAVPSGRIRVTARTPSTAWGEEEVSLPAGGSGTVSLVLDPDKEVIEDTDLVLAEAVSDTLPPSAGTFTLKFVQDDVLVPVTRLDRVELLDGNDNLQDLLDGMFTVVSGMISATDPASVYARLSKFAGEKAGLRVQAADEAGFTHANVVWFQVRASTRKAGDRNPR